jgi:hypothetical protein
MKHAWAVFVMAVAAAPAFAHRLDEYLQATMLEVGKDHVGAEITLTPGVSVLPFLTGVMDANRDGVISAVEQRLYAARIQGDLSLKIDGRPVQLLLQSAIFPAMEEMKEGRGEIRLGFTADLPKGGGNRRLSFENHHQSKIAAYQVNALVPRDPGIRIVSQNRDPSQSHFELNFAQAAPFTGLASSYGLIGSIGLFLIARLAIGCYSVARPSVAAGTADRPRCASTIPR